MKILTILSLLVVAARAQLSAEDIRALIQDDYHQNPVYTGQVTFSPFTNGSYQALARDETVVRYEGESGVSATHIINYYVLRCILAATNRKSNPRIIDMTTIPQWTNIDNWNTNPDFCTWYGITCEYFGPSSGLVTQIDLARNNLSGTWPEEVAFLGEHLEMIDLFSNPAQYCGKYDWFQSMEVLRFLFVGTTSWDSVGIPTTLKFLDNLCMLCCSYL